MVEHLHRIICELGMTMVFYSGAPLYLRVAFTTSIFLLNHLPSTALNQDTPYFKLDGMHLNYFFLRVFRSKCFSYTQGSQKHKFVPNTVSCVFLGYSNWYRGTSVSIHLTSIYTQNVYFSTCGF